MTKTINKSTIPPKGQAEITVTLTMESELAAKPRDILIAWDFFGQSPPMVGLNNIDRAIRRVLSDLVGLSGGANGKLGGGSRVALYGNRANTGEIRTELTADTAVILAALDAAAANAQPGLAVVADSMVEMLAGATNRKTLLICNLTESTALNTAEKTKVENAGIEMFTLSAPLNKGAKPWGGTLNSSTGVQGPAVLMAGMPQNLFIEDYLEPQFSGENVTATIGEATYSLPVLGKPYCASWEVGPPEARTGVQTYTMTYTAVDEGPDVGRQLLSTLHAKPKDMYTSAGGEEITDIPGAVLMVNIAEDPAPGGGDGTDPAPGGGDGTDPAPGGGDGTDPAPTPGGGDGTDPAPTPGGGDGTDPAPTPGGGDGTDPAPTPGGGDGTDPAPTPGGGDGTDPAPTPGGGDGTDPAPTPGSVRAENWPAPTEITVGQCKDSVQASVPEAQLLSLGRLVQLDVVLKNICPGKRVSATILLTEKNADGVEETRAMKHILVPAQTGTACADVTLRCIQFSVPEALDLSGDPASICNERKFNVRVIANYVDSDMILCDTGTVTV